MGVEQSLDQVVLAKIFFLFFLQFAYWQARGALLVFPHKTTNMSVRVLGVFYLLADASSQAVHIEGMSTLKCITTSEKV